MRGMLRTVWLLVCAQSCHIVADHSYLYGQLVRKTHDRSHIDSTRNIENLKIARHFGFRLCNILHHVELWRSPAPEQHRTAPVSEDHVCDLDPRMVIDRKREEILESRSFQQAERWLKDTLAIFLECEWKRGALCDESAWWRTRVSPDFKMKFFPIFSQNFIEKIFMHEKLSFKLLNQSWQRDLIAQHVLDLKALLCALSKW